jgi:nicotinate-nucleotide pyrophosphorylase (carboxylating)
VAKFVFLKLMLFDVRHPEIVQIVKHALEEDIGTGDVTSEACVPAWKRAQGRFVAREPIVVAGVELLPLIYELRGGAEEVKLVHQSGDAVEQGDVLATVRGRARALLTSERVALNFMQRLSGIATLASRYVDAVAGTKCRILDTRKTTPGLRRLEKMAAEAGGVMNHRLGLFDAILIKNNHIEAAGGVRPALKRALLTGLPVEIEVRTPSELDQALAGGAKHLLLDNLTPPQAAEQIRYIAGRATVELSGGITLATIREYAKAGADFISCGAITHSATAVDINFRLELSLAPDDSPA